MFNNVPTALELVIITGPEVGCGEYPVLDIHILPKGQSSKAQRAKSNGDSNLVQAGQSVDRAHYWCIQVLGHGMRIHYRRSEMTRPDFKSGRPLHSLNIVA